jgi:iron complex transport system substrate-binding protein
MIRRAGGTDVLAAQGDHSKVVQPADVLAAQPDVVLVAPCGYGLERAAVEARRMVARAEWQLPDTTSVWALDGNSLTSRPGPRLVDGIEVMARIFNPSLFTPIDSSYATCVSSSSRAGRQPAREAPQTIASATTH